MGYIIFEKHPGDLLTTINHQDKHMILIEIGNFKLNVIGLIKLTPQRAYKVNLEFPKNKTARDAFIKTLNDWLVRKEILNYSSI